MLEFLLPGMRLTKNQKNILTLLTIGLILYGAGYLLLSKVVLPQDFTDARIRAAKQAEELVLMLNESSKNLNLIAQSDRDFEFNKALSLTDEELLRAKQTKKKAGEINNELVTMLQSTPSISPVKARNLAMEAMSYEVSLLKKIIAYNDSLSALLQTLNYKFSGDIRYDADDVQKLIENMNDNAREINELNNLYNQRMKEFDEITK